MTRTEFATVPGRAGRGLRVPPLPLLAAAALLTLAPVETARAGGPLLLGREGKPRKWSAERPVALNPDQGALGGISDPRGLLSEVIAVWNGVTTATLKLTIGDSLSTDQEGLSEAEFNAFITRDDGRNPVIFDSSGAIFEALYGPGSGVIGVAGPTLIRSSDGTIVKGFAMFNGQDIAANESEQVRAIMTHELGHFLNLEHSQINGLRFGGTVAGFDGTVPLDSVETMYPVLIQSSARPHPMSSLHRDDIAALSSLYPSPLFAASTSAITGQVLDVDGTTPIQGLNVVARNVNDPFHDAVSQVSGVFYGTPPSTAPAALRGAYELRGLTPSATYKVYIEEVSSLFRGGARVGPLDPPLDVDPQHTAAFLEFWNDAEESSEDPPDAPLEAALLRLNPGGVAAGTDFRFNGVSPRVTGASPSEASYLQITRVTITGANFIGATDVTLERQGRILRLFDVSVLSANALKASIPSGGFPGEYEVFVSNESGTSARSGVTLRITEPAPAITGLSPPEIDNSRSQRLTIQGDHFLGAVSARLVRTGQADIALDVVTPTNSTRLQAQVPSGILPGAYSVIVRNTAGDGARSPMFLLVVELAPLLTPQVEPDSASNRKAKDIRISGSNLAGTTLVELVNGAEAVPLVVRSSSLTEVVASVPAGLIPASYTIRLTNSEASTTGPAVFTVTKARSGGGGGGCVLGRARAQGPLDPEAEGESGESLLETLGGLALLAATLAAFRARSRERRA